MIEEASKKIKDLENPAWQVFLFTAIFLGIPLFLSWIGYREILVERRENYQARQKEMMQSALSRISAAGDTEEYLETLLKALEKKVFSASNPQRAFKKWKKTVRKRFPNVFQFTFLGPDGNPLQEFCDFPVPRVFLRRFFQDCKDFFAGDLADLGKQASFATSFLGAFVNIEEKIFQKLIYASAIEGKEFVFLSLPRPQGMFICHVNRSKDWETLGIMDLLSLQHQKQIFRIALITKSFPESADYQHLGISPRQGRKIWTFLSNRLEGNFRFKQSLWGKKVVKQSVSLFCRLETSGDSIILSQLGSMKIAFCSIWFVASFLLSWAIFSHRVRRLSVRSRLALAFLYAAGIPLLTMGVSALSFLSERRSVLENRLHSTIERALLGFDSNFPKAINELERSLRSAFWEFVHPSGQPDSDLVNRLFQLHKKFNWGAIKVFDQNGKKVSEMFGSSSRQGSSQSPKMFEGASESILQKINLGLHDPLAAKNPKLKKIKEKTGGAEIDWALSKISRQMGKLASYQIGDGRILIITFPIFDELGIARFVSFISWGRTTLEREYIRNQLQVFSRSLLETEVFAFCRKSPEDSLPPKFRFSKAIKPFLSVVQSREFGQRKKLSGEKKLLLTGIMGRELTDYSLIGVSHDRSIRQEIRKTAVRLGLMALFFSVLSAGIGLLVAQKFLFPISAIENGMLALKRREFRFRIPQVGNDELGDLCKIFNNLMEDVSDMETAAAIQENLFPADALSFGGWEIYGKCKPASRVGGDYFDYFPLGESRTAFIIADVSGHGVSAALVMAMAKAVIAHPSTEFEPSRVMTILQTIFLATLERKKMMTCTVGVFDAIKGVVTLCNAGHSFPYIVGELEAREVEIIGTPVGTKSRRPYSSNCFPVKDSEFVLFYSDGLIEAFDTEGKVIGFTRLAQALPRLRGENARDTEMVVRKWNAQLTGNAPQDDDMTILVIQKGREDVPEGCA